ncbi:MAG: hypothetical protein U5Q44_03655 [Dehalococcoidia bacterium]|nr:hypothetical protein [Dehalococcoidia bacterium]
MDPNDDFMHPVGDDSAWSESYYFNFCDPRSEVGLFARMGFRANEGTVDGLMGIYLGGHRVAFIYGREQLPEPYDTLQAGGMSFDRREPFRTWGIRYDGPAQDICRRPHPGDAAERAPRRSGTYPRTSPSMPRSRRSTSPTTPPTMGRAATSNRLVR